LCSAAFCFASDGAAGVEFWVYSRRADDPDAGWDLEGTTCVAGEQRVTVADVQREVTLIIDREFRRVAEPSVTLAPAGTALVNLPVIAWTEETPPLDLAIDQPLPGQIEASPTFAWRWSDGSSASGAGRPYDPSISPLDTPDYYVHAAPRDVGRLRTELTVTWNGTVTVPGLPPVPIDPLVYRSQADVLVGEARSELVAEPN
jgi:hypothetical protein